MKRTPLKSYKPLRAKVGLKSRIGLKAHKPMNRISKKQAIKNALWVKIKQERIGLLIARYGYLPDEYSGENITNEAIIDAHHNDRNRNHNFLTNCRILKRLSHSYVTDNNVKNIKDWLK
jgi:hypothetical protein